MKITLKKVKMKTSLKKLRSKSHHKNTLKKHETANQLIFFFLSKTILKVHLCKAVSFLQKVCSQLLNARVRFKPTVVETLGRLIFSFWSSCLKDNLFCIKWVKCMVLCYKGFQVLSGSFLFVVIYYLTGCVEPLLHDILQHRVHSKYLHFPRKPDKTWF